MRYDPKMILKVCGMRDMDNISHLSGIGVRMMGFIFYDKSKRFIGLENRNALFNNVPKNVKKVGVFVNEPIEALIENASHYHLDYVQLHGNESPDYCKEVQTKIKVIKAFRIDENFDFNLLEEFQNCEYLLFDAKGKEYGGNGIKFDWSVLEKYKMETPFILSGGIKLEDADDILSIQHPKMAGIDINSGFEIEPGLKNIEKIKSFISLLR